MKAFVETRGRSGLYSSASDYVQTLSNGGPRRCSKRSTSPTALLHACSGCNAPTPRAVFLAGIASGSFLHRKADYGTVPASRSRGRRLATNLRRGLALPVGCAGLLIPPPDHAPRRGGPRPPAGVSERLNRCRLGCSRSPGTLGALARLPGGTPVPVQRRTRLPARRGLYPTPGPCCPPRRPGPRGPAVTAGPYPRGDAPGGPALPC